MSKEEKKVFSEWCSVMGSLLIFLIVLTIPPLFAYTENYAVPYPCIPSSSIHVTKRESLSAGSVPTLDSLYQMATWTTQSERSPDEHQLP